MKNIQYAVTGLLMLVASTALADDVLHRPQKQTGSCSPPLTLLTAQTMEASRSFSVDVTGNGGYDIFTIYLSLTDANTSITRFDLTCTVSFDGNATDYGPQVCDDTSDGICTQTLGGKWQKASPGSINWTARMDVVGFQDVECTVAVGTGTGAAADLITVKGMLCGV